MKGKVSFVEFFSTLGMGLWQAICWVCKVFNPKYKTTFWRVIWAIIALSLLIFTSVLCYAFISEQHRKDNYVQKTDDIHPPKTVISVHFSLRDQTFL